MGMFSRKKVEKAVGPANALVPQQAPALEPMPMGGGAYGPTVGMAGPPAVPWDGTTFKIQLKMAKNRVEIQRGKKDNEIDNSRRIVAQHLASNKLTLARIQAERVLRERTQIRAFDVFETMVELLANSNNAIGMHQTFDSLPGDIKEAMASVIYASKRLNVPEVHTVLEILRRHFGAGVVDPLMNLQGPYVIHINKILATSLDASAPDGYLIMEELSNVAVEYNVNWIPPAEPESLDSHHVVSSQHGQNFPPPGHFGGGGGMGPGGGGYCQGTTQAPAPYAFSPPAHIPGMPGPLDPTGMPWMAGSADVPSAPPAPSAPPFELSSYATGSLYPSPGDYGGMRDGSAMPSAPSAPPMDKLDPSAPPPYSSSSGPPDSDLLNDDDLEAKLRNVRDNYSRK